MSDWVDIFWFFYVLGGVAFFALAGALVGKPPPHTEAESPDMVGCPDGVEAPPRTETESPVGTTPGQSSPLSTTENKDSTFWLRLPDLLARSIMRAAGDEGLRPTDWMRVVLEKAVKEHPTYQIPAQSRDAMVRTANRLSIPAQFRDAMVMHALEEDPNECCGLLAGAGGRVLGHYRITNTEKSPYRYSMDGKELLAAYREIEDNGWEIQVIYHSHTHSPAYPSATDIRFATWPDVYYLLISLMDERSPDIRMFEIAGGDVAEEPVVIT